MAKKKVKDFNVDVDTDKVDVKVEKKGKDLKVEVDTPNVDVKFTKEGKNKEFNYDGKKVDVNVKNVEGRTEVVVDSESHVLKKIATFITKLFVKKK